MKVGVSINLLKGTMRGYPDNTFKPKMHVIRAESQMVIKAIVDKSERHPYQPDLTGKTVLTEKTPSGTITQYILSSPEFVDAFKTITESVLGFTADSQYM
jgi:hypothetical protein